jgi:hypothetical protein
MPITIAPRSAAPLERGRDVGGELRVVVELRREVLGRREEDRVADELQEHVREP